LELVGFEVDEEPLLLRFPSSKETNRFHRTLADSSWRRGEDTTRLRTLHKRVAAALSDTEALLAAVNNVAAVAAAGGGGTINIISSPSPRSPFTLASLPPRGNSNHTARTASTSSSSSGCFNLASAVAAAASDLDPDWRNHATTPKYVRLYRGERSLIGLISVNVLYNE
jgi:hypothetical protein